MRFLIKTLNSFLLALLLAGAAAGQVVVSGEYEDLLLAVGKDGVLTGYFHQGTGDDGKGNPRFTCTFFIRGSSEDGGRYELRTWHPAFPDEVISGELTFSDADGRKAVNLRLHGEHGGCWNVAPVLKEDDGVDFELTKTGDWQSLRMVSANRAYFHTSADAKTRGRGYVVKNDVVRAVRMSGDWVEAVFIGKDGKTSRGWLQAKDFYSIESKETEKLEDLGSIWI